MGKATQDLRSEHEAILNVFGIMDKAFSRDTKEDGAVLDFGNEVVYFLKIFADKCHHGKEEGYLFTELSNKGVKNEDGPIGVMLMEHQQGREYIAQMSKSLDAKDLGSFKIAAVQYRDLLRKHITKENNVLFVMADSLLDDDQQDDLAEKFETFEEGIIGHGVHEQLHGMIHQWEQKFGEE